MRKLTDEEKQRRVDHFRRVIKYRSWFGWVFTVVGGTLFGVGLQNSQNPLIMINGVLFFGYGLFMVRQTKKGSKELGSWRMLRNSFFPSLWVQHGRVGRVVFREVYAHS